MSPRADDDDDDDIQFYQLIFVLWCNRNGPLKKTSEEKQIRTFLLHMKAENAADCLDSAIAGEEEEFEEEELASETGEVNNQQGSV